MSKYADELMVELLKIADSNSDLHCDERDHCRKAISWIRDADTALAAKDAEIAALRERCEAMAALLRRYRTETPLGHQPHMIASKADDLLAEVENRDG